jgi:hypothetical protein
MKSIQTKLTETIFQLFEDNGFELINVSKLSNLGYWSIQKSNSLKELGAIGYEFQDSYNMFTITIGGRRVPSQVGRDDYFTFHIQTSDNQTLQTFLNNLQKEIEFLKESDDTIEDGLLKRAKHTLALYMSQKTGKTSQECFHNLSNFINDEV